MRVGGDYEKKEMAEECSPEEEEVEEEGELEEMQSRLEALRS